MKIPFSGNRRKNADGKGLTTCGFFKDILGVHDVNTEDKVAQITEIKAIGVQDNTAFRLYCELDSRQPSMLPADTSYIHDMFNDHALTYSESEDGSVNWYKPSEYL
ncbi:hypothetical protein BO71DRAFT_408391 [Aspergillus ellipticus CBS 707.79]|uniref:Uncharacterized protein n=1 Tax=Aspergillus ellipticus CBS 707.79 TaxID=1448320 RepID=A0A319DEJ8_9EURO|nr:hypothetical protein BO71DRAFT_408391 [Aspergillus ellipticus CBS 707.79]